MSLMRFIELLKSQATSTRLLITAAACLLAFGLLAYLVQQDSTAPFDIGLLRSLHQTASPLQDRLWLAITGLAGLTGMTVLTGVAMAGFWFKSQYRLALLILVSVAGAALLNNWLKLLFIRSRPDMWPRLLDEAGYSFPSGHAMISLALGLSLLLLLWPTRWRWPAAGLAGLFVVLVGISRLYLGVHFPTDVVAGWLAGAVWVTVVLATASRYQWGSSLPTS
jgi:undecaprenyl-diphosphatase